MARAEPGGAAMALDLPPLLEAVPCPRGGDLLGRAAEGASEGRYEAGAFVYRVTDRRIAFALVLEPTVGRAEAAAMRLLAQLAATEALAHEAPPETEVRHDWRGTISINGADAGEAVGVMGPGEPSDWLAVGATLRADARLEPGIDPGRTSLAEEFGPVDATAILNAIGRQLTLWLHRWEGEGFAPIARAWLSRQVEGGRAVSLDDEGNALVRSDDGVRQLPLLGQWKQHA